MSGTATLPSKMPTHGNTLHKKDFSAGVADLLAKERGQVRIFATDRPTKIQFIIHVENGLLIGTTHGAGNDISACTCPDVFKANCERRVGTGISRATAYRVNCTITPSMNARATSRNMEILLESAGEYYQNLFGEKATLYYNDNVDESKSVALTSNLQETMSRQPPQTPIIIPPVHVPAPIGIVTTKPNQNDINTMVEKENETKKNKEEISNAQTYFIIGAIVLAVIVVIIGAILIRYFVSKNKTTTLTNQKQNNQKSLLWSNK